MTATRTLAVLTLVACAAPSVSHAPASNSGPGSGGDPVSPAGKGLYLGDYHVVLDSTSLGEVVAHFGKGEMADTTIANEHVVAVCYTTAGADPARVVLESGDLGGSERDVLAFTVTDEEVDPRACPTLPVARADVRTDSGIRLGMSREAVRATIERGPILQVQDEIIATVSDSIPDMAGSWAYVDAGLKARFRRDRLSNLYIWLTLST